MSGPLLKTTLGTAIFIDVLRIFLPSLITIFGSAGATPAELIGVYALSWFLAAYLAVAVARLIGARHGARVVGLVGALVLVAGRAVLQFTDGDKPQLYVASAALAGGLWWLVGAAIRGERAFPLGLMWGLAVAAGLHAALDTVDLAWRDGPVPIALVAVELLAFLVTLYPAFVRSAPQATRELAPRAWLAVGPAILLWGLYPGNPAHAQAAAGVNPVVAVAAVVVAGFLATVFAQHPRRLSGHPAVPALVLVGSAVAFSYGAVTVDGVHGVAPWWTVLAQVFGVLALGACLGWIASARSTVDRPYRRGLLLATGFLLFIVFAFAYYSAYDLGIPNDYAPIALAAILGVLAIVRTGAPDGVAQRFPALRALTGAVVAVAAIAAIPWWRAAPAAPVPPADGLRIAAYNIRMGFGLAGTMTVRSQAETLRDLHPQVIVLSEVDRGWFLNGGHDDLRLIAQSLGMRFIWAPAADEVWGDALLTNLPVTSVHNYPLVKGGPTGAEALQVGLRWNGRDITVIATHLQPPTDWQPLDQVEQLADIVRAAPKPTVVAGDMNLEPGDPAWDVIRGAGLLDAFAAVRPFNTGPSPNPPEQIDQILTTAGFSYADPAHPDVPFSDHRPVAVTLIPS